MQITYYKSTPQKRTLLSTLVSRSSAESIDYHKLSNNPTIRPHTHRSFSAHRAENRPRILRIGKLKYGFHRKLCGESHDAMTVQGCSFSVSPNWYVIFAGSNGYSLLILVMVVPVE